MFVLFVCLYRSLHVRLKEAFQHAWLTEERCKSCWWRCVGGYNLWKEILEFLILIPEVQMRHCSEQIERFPLLELTSFCFPACGRTPIPKSVLLADLSSPSSLGCFLQIAQEKKKSRASQQHHQGNCLRHCLLGKEHCCSFCTSKGLASNQEHPFV